jgi:hypothetical protein
MYVGSYVDCIARWCGPGKDYAGATQGKDDALLFSRWLHPRLVGHRNPNQLRVMHRLSALVPVRWGVAPKYNLACLFTLAFSRAAII